VEIKQGFEVLGKANPQMMAYFKKGHVKTCPSFISCPWLFMASRRHGTAPAGRADRKRHRAASGYNAALAASQRQENKAVSP